MPSISSEEIYWVFWIGFISINICCCLALAIMHSEFIGNRLFLLSQWDTKKLKCSFLVFFNTRFECSFWMVISNSHFEMRDLREFASFKRNPFLDSFAFYLLPSWTFFLFKCVDRYLFTYLRKTRSIIEFSKLTQNFTLWLNGIFVLKMRVEDERTQSSDS